MGLLTMGEEQKFRRLEGQVVKKALGWVMGKRKKDV